MSEDKAEGKDVTPIMNPEERPDHPSIPITIE